MLVVHHHGHLTPVIPGIVLIGALCEGDKAQKCAGFPPLGLGNLNGANHAVFQVTDVIPEAIDQICPVSRLLVADIDGVTIANKVVGTHEVDTLRIGREELRIFTGIHLLRHRSSPSIETYHGDSPHDRFYVLFPSILEGKLDELGAQFGEAVARSSGGIGEKRGARHARDGIRL